MRDISTLLDCWQDLDLCELAQAYAKAGLYVFPLAPREKRPMAGSRGFKDATVNPEQIAAWWEQYPDMNIGIATGTVSGILVVDVDAHKGGMETLATLGLVPTLTAITGNGGRHIIYAIPPGVNIKSACERWPGVDIKCEGGYIVAPGSVHPNGNQYVWADDSPLAATTISYALVRTLLQARASDKARARSVIHRGKLRIDTMAYIKAGERNPRFASLAGMLKVRDYALDDALAFCREVNATKTEQGKGWSEREMSAIVCGIFKRYA